MMRTPPAAAAVPLVLALLTVSCGEPTAETSTVKPVTVTMTASGPEQYEQPAFFRIEYFQISEA